MPPGPAWGPGKGMRASKDKVVELTYGDRVRPGRLSMSTTASTRGYAGFGVLLHEAPGWADAVVVDKTGAGVDTARRCAARHGPTGPGVSVTSTSAPRTSMPYPRGRRPQGLSPKGRGKRAPESPRKEAEGQGRRLTQARLIGVGYTSQQRPTSRRCQQMLESPPYSMSCERSLSTRTRHQEPCLRKQSPG